MFTLKYKIPVCHNKGQSRGTTNHCTRFNYNLIIIVNTTYKVLYATQAVKV